MPDHYFPALISTALAHPHPITDLVLVLRDGHKCWPEADGQVVWVHHVLVTELAQATNGRIQATC